jgi:hypothetical protein
LAGDETGNGDGGKSDGDDDKVGGQATASNGEGGRRLTATRAMATVTGTAKTWVMAKVTRLAGNEEGKGEGGKGRKTISTCLT